MTAVYRKQGLFLCCFTAEHGVNTEPRPQSLYAYASTILI